MRTNISLACEEEMGIEPVHEDSSLAPLYTQCALSIDDVLERIELMTHTEKGYAPNPRYMEEIQAMRLRVAWRSKVAEWLYAVSLIINVVALKNLRKKRSELPPSFFVSFKTIFYIYISKLNM